TRNWTGRCRCCCRRTCRGWHGSRGRSWGERCEERPPGGAGAGGFPKWGERLQQIAEQVGERPRVLPQIAVREPFMTAEVIEQVIDVDDPRSDGEVLLDDPHQNLVEGVQA